MSAITTSLLAQPAVRVAPKAARSAASSARAVPAAAARFGSISMPRTALVQKASVARTSRKTAFAAVAQLNTVVAADIASFDADGVKVSAGKGDLPMVTLTGADGSVAECYLHGGVCTSWKPKGGDDVLYVRPDAKFDKSKPISGGIPHCFPQFGPGDMQVHGFARNCDWELTASTGGASPSITMTLTENDYTKAMWPTAFKAEQTITLMDGKLKAELTVTNTDKKEFSFTSSFHTYFATSNLAELKVEGLDGSKVLDRLANAEGTCDGPVSIASEVDSVYFGAPSKVTCKTGGGKVVNIESAGWVDGVVWNPWTTMEACYKEFFCYEPAVVATPVKVAPGASWSGSMTLSA